MQTNGKQYIDTGVSQGNTEHAKYTVSLDGTSTNGNHVLSSKDTYFPLLKISLEGEKQVLANLNGAEAFGSYDWDLDTKYELEGIYCDAWADMDDTWNTKGAVINGERVLSYTTTSTINDTTPKLYLFCYGGSPTAARYTFRGKLYDCKIYRDNSDTELLRNFIPCRQESDGVVGLYDLIESKFYHSDSGTELIGGKEI